MIFASKKVVCIVLFQLLFIIVNDANGSLFSYNKQIIKAIRFLKNNANCVGIHKLAMALKLVNGTEEQDVKFHFASRNKPNFTTVTLQHGTISSFKNVDFNPFERTVLISHGFLSSGNESWLRDMKDAFLKYGPYNVIVVDWEKDSNTWNYIGASGRTQNVGKAIATLFSQIRSEMRSNFTSNQNFGKIHFVGHSLGAHIVAHAAHLIKEYQRNKHTKTKWIVNRITGLDPAQPCFSFATKNQRLDEEDAEFVDVIHTNAQHPLAIGFGMPERIGDMDFYPNGGNVQIGCDSVDTSIWSHLGLPVDDLKEAICSHGRSHQFFIESIIESKAKNCTFTSHLWYDQENVAKELLLKDCAGRDCPTMGIDAMSSSRRRHGIFFTPTGHEAPYCTVKNIDKQLIKDHLTYNSLLARAWAFIKRPFTTG